jgi:alpha-tubulin suppressor-like RCC1 family protein
MRKNGQSLSLQLTLLGCVFTLTYSLGMGCSSDHSSTPDPEKRDLDDVVAVSAGRLHACAVSAAGRVLCWGDNAAGQLGVPRSTVSTGDAVLVETLQGVQQVAAGSASSCAVKNDGSLWCWGGHGYAALVDAERPHVPQHIPFHQPVVRVASSGGHTCALLDDGAVYCWGLNCDGAAGPDNRASCNGEAAMSCVNEPTAVLESGATDLVTGQGYTCALLAEGPACWGEDFVTLQPAGCGDGGMCNAQGCDSRAAPLATTATLTALSGGTRHVCGKAASAVVCWGYNEGGVTGNPDQTSSALTTVPMAVEEVALGDTFTCALRLDRNVVCWGTPPGESDVHPADAPLVLDTEGNIVSLVGAYDSLLAVREDGRVSSWRRGKPVFVRTWAGR